MAVMQFIHFQDRKIFLKTSFYCLALTEQVFRSLIPAQGYKRSCPNQRGVRRSAQEALTKHESISWKLPSRVIRQLHWVHINIFMSIRADGFNDPPTDFIPRFLQMSTTGSW